MAGQLQDVTVALGGKNYSLRYSIRATLFLKELWGLEHEREVQARMAKAGMGDFVDILWAGLQTHHRADFPAPMNDEGAREASRDKLIDLLDDEGTEGLATMVADAMERATPPRPAGGPPKGQRTKKRTR